MKKRNNSETVQDINLIDLACQNASKIVDELSIKSSLKNRMWNDISEKLSSINKKVLSWFLISATSVSVLVASTALIKYYVNDYTKKNKHLNSITQLHSIDKNSNNSTENSSSHTLTHYVLPEIERKDISTTLHPIEKVIHLTEIKATKKETSIYNIAPIKYRSTTSPIKTNITVNGYTNNTFSPEIGLDYVVYKHIKGHNFFSVRLGLSALIRKPNNVHDSETISNNLTSNSSLFSNVSFEVGSIDNKNIWNGKIGYLIKDSQDSVFERNTVRLSLQRNLNKHIKVGPELIMTNNFKRFYPSFGITVEG